MSNFQRLLESPFHWVAHEAASFAGAFFKPQRDFRRDRRPDRQRRRYLNG